MSKKSICVYKTKRLSYCRNNGMIVVDMIEETEGTPWLYEENVCALEICL